MHPLEYADQNEEEDDEKSEDKQSSYGDEDDSSDGEKVDVDAPLGVGKPVDRNNIKT